MIKPVFDKSIVTPNSIDLRISYEEIPWICGSIDKFYCNYYTTHKYHPLLTQKKYLLNYQF